MIIFHHHHLERDQTLLLDQNWMRTDYYELSCRSELWGTAFMVTLDKTIANTADEAIIYMLERLVAEGRAGQRIC